MERSVRAKDGPVNMLRPSLPIQTLLPARLVTECDVASANAAGLKNRSGATPENGLLTMSARVFPLQELATTLKGWPASAAKITLACQPAINLSTPLLTFEPINFPLPKGRS